MRRPLRLRTLFVAGGCVAVLVVAAAVFLAVPGAVRVASGEDAGAERVAAVVDAVRGTVLAGAVASLIVVIPLCLWLADVVRASIGGLRLAVAQAAGPEGVTGPPVPSDFALIEVSALAAAIGRALEAYQRRIRPLESERDELALLIDSVGEGIVQVGPDGRIVRANRAARAMLGLPPEVDGQPVSTLVREPQLLAGIEAAIRGREREPAELPLGGRRVLAVVHPLTAPADGRAGRGAAAILVDITALRRLESVRRDFVANASHELKTPLTSIRGYAETLLSDEELSPEMRRQFLETIQQNAHRLQRIVDDLLDLSRLESGGWRPELEAADVAELAAGAWSSLRERAEAKGVAFRIETGGDAVALADPLGLDQVFTNLLDNALRYTPGGGQVTVRISPSGPPPGPVVTTSRGGLAGLFPFRRQAAGPGGAADADRWICVEVRDTGGGIPSEALGRIFERFYRVDPARSRAEGGTGLGLAIVKHLIESMGGDVAAESELGKGTAIRFWLPRPAGHTLRSTSAAG